MHIDEYNQIVLLYSTSQYLRHAKARGWATLLLGRLGEDAMLHSPRAGTIPTRRGLCISAC